MNHELRAVESARQTIQLHQLPLQMNLPSSPPTQTGTFAPFEAPIPSEASAALSAILAHGPSAELSEKLLSLSERRLGAAAGLFRALRLKHPVTANHAMRVAMGCALFLSRLDVDPLTREQVELASLLHDIGKLAIPDHLLNKTTPLTVSEQAVLQRHLELAVHIIEPFCEDQMIGDIIRYSGHWFDGSKSPEPCGEAIPFGSRVLAILNAYDSMTTDMVYRAALSHDRALNELCVHSGTQFDPELVTKFVELQADKSTAYNMDLIRHWVNCAQGQVDSVWTLAASISDADEDTQAIFQRRLLESMHDGVLFVDLSGRVIIWNRGAAELTGLSRESIHYKQWAPNVVELRDMEGNIVKGKSCPTRACLLAAEESTHRFTITNRLSKQRIAIKMHVMPVRDSKQTCHGVIMIMHDVSSEFSLEETVQTLHSKATTDALTGVNNRAEFDRQQAQLVAQHSESGEPLSLIICDIDRFKSINDTYGHQAGDDALKSFANHIASLSRDDDFVARYGGEEFVIICPNCGVHGAVKKAEKIRKTLAQTAQSALRGTVMTASFGVSQLRKKDTAEAMLKRADSALYAAKKGGRNRVHQNEFDSPTTNPESVTEPWSWFTKKEKTKKTTAIEHDLKSQVPTEILNEKIRGFVVDNSAEVIRSTERLIELRFANSLAGQRRTGDRFVPLTMEIILREDENETGTLIEVEILFRSGRERRIEDVTEQAQLLLKNFKSYLMAEDA